MNNDDLKQQRPRTLIDEQQQQLVLNNDDWRTRFDEEFTFNMPESDNGHYALIKDFIRSTLQAHHHALMASLPEEKFPASNFGDLGESRENHGWNEYRKHVLEVLNKQKP